MSEIVRHFKVCDRCDDPFDADAWPCCPVCYVAMLDNVFNISVAAHV